MRKTKHRPHLCVKNSLLTLLESRDSKEKPLWTPYYYGKKYDLMEVGRKKTLILKRKSDSDPVVRIVPTEEFYHILRDTHQLTGHGGRDKMLYSLKSKYFIPTSVVLEFLKLCTVCQSKKKFPRKGIVVCPILSSDFNHRGQVDLIDLQSTPDRNYKWLLHYQDHGTKFSFLRPLTSKRAAEVAIELLKIFLEVGCPKILQSDNGREFTAAVIQELTAMWPTCKIVNGRPRHPASQGSVERSNQDVEAMLRAWLIDNGTKNWGIGCYFVQFQKNSSFHRTIKRSPYKALFGTEPKIGLHSSHIPAELLEKLVTEEDLDQFLKQQQTDETDNSEDVPATEHNDFSTQVSTENLLTAEPTFSIKELDPVLDPTSAPISADTTPVLLGASEGAALDGEEKRLCIVCENTVEGGDE
ncbi:KRAB-A domain-containing protein 2-like [Onthophagus taurus]|uniref:KRAB-A domain-containing protein 2-like n=1 Tax=Onthophagus taurus TaxID=166361 RepID=UPI0039BE8C5E